MDVDIIHLRMTSLQDLGKGEGQGQECEGGSSAGP